MKYALCIDAAPDCVPFYDRIQIAKDAGYDAVEFWNPSDYDCKKVGSIAANAGIPISDCCVKDAWTIRMTFPWRIVKENLAKTFEHGQDLGTSTFICLSGDLNGLRDDEQLLLLENLKRAGEEADKAGATLVLEALNSIYDHKGYYLDSAYIGLELIKAVDCPNIRLLYDVYHMQLMQGNLINTIRDNIEFIGHFHSAGVPGRHEIMDTEVTYPAVIKAIEESGYQGYFGLEYFASYDGIQSVKDSAAYLKSLGY